MPFRPLINCISDKVTVSLLSKLEYGFSGSGSVVRAIVTFILLVGHYYLQRFWPGLFNRFESQLGCYRRLWMAHVMSFSAEAQSSALAISSTVNYCH